MAPRKLLTIAALLLLIGQPLEAQKVYRWVDEDGKVHYSESLPPDLRDASHDVLDEHGITVDEGLTLTPEPVEPEPEEPDLDLPSDASGMERKAMYSEAELRHRMDNLLLLRYDSEQEIADAMQVEINQLAYDERVINKSRASISKSYREQINDAADRQRAGLEVDPNMDDTIMELRLKLEQHDESMAILKRREENIRNDFTTQIERYRTLVAERGEDEEGDPESG